MASEKGTRKVEPIPSMGVEKLSEAIARNHTIHDQKDMRRMGKKQEFLRNFRIFTSIAFTSCVMGTYEILLTSNTSALVSGGLAGYLKPTQQSQRQAHVLTGYGGNSYGATWARLS